MGEDRFFEVRNPARFEEVIDRVPLMTSGDVDAVLQAAHGAYPAWAALKPEERSARLRASVRDLKQALPRLSTLFVRENGKPMREAERDIQRSIELTSMVAEGLADWFAPRLLDARQPVWARRRPRGVAAVISPWNSPVLLSFKRFIPALAAGNTVVVKPATNCPLTVREAIQIMAPHFPPGVLNVVIGSG